MTLAVLFLTSLRSRLSYEAGSVNLFPSSISPMNPSSAYVIQGRFLLLTAQNLVWYSFCFIQQESLEPRVVIIVLAAGKFKTETQ